LSQDGNTLVTSSRDDSNSIENEADNSSEDSGAVYIFRRIGAGWRQEKYLKSGRIQPGQQFGIGYPLGHRALAISGNGMVVAVGAPRERVNGVEDSGAVYLFVRDIPGAWNYANDGIMLPAPQPLDYFGVSVDLNDDGTLLKVTSLAPYDAEGHPTGTTYLYQRTETAWTLYSQFGSEPGDHFCGSQMSADGDAIVALCDNPVTGPVIRARHRSFRAWSLQDIALPSYHAQQPALSGNSARMAVLTTNAAGARVVNVYGWTGSAFVRETQLESPAGTATDYPSWGEALAFNRNGTMLAVGDYTNSSGGAGVSNAPLPPNAPPPFNKDGAVFVYRRESSGWTLSRVVKAPNSAHIDSFGRDIALSGNGLTMAIGAPAEDSAARGIDGNQADNSKPSAGAIYLY